MNFSDIKVEIKLCTDKRPNQPNSPRPWASQGVLYAAEGEANQLHLKVPLEAGGDSRQTITSSYDVTNKQVYVDTLSGTLGDSSGWTAPWVEFDYTSQDVLCIEKLTVSDTVDTSLVYNIVQDYDPNAFDVVASDPGWISRTNEKIVHFADSCYYDSNRLITQVCCSIIEMT